MVSLTLASGQELDSLSKKYPDVYTLVDEAASYPGGTKAWEKYLRNNLIYPAEAIKSGVEGRVFIQYIVEINGKGSDIKVVKGIGAGCDEEALRLIREMPKWTPAKKNGKLVRQIMIQNVLFELP